jgi:hypothetical protein
MDQLDTYLIFTQPLEACDLAYMATGAVASTLYGYPRFTHDLDLVLELPADRAADLARVFPLEQFYAPPDEVMRVEARRPLRGHFNIIHHDTGFKADVYLLGRDPLHVWGMAHRQRIAIDQEHGIWVAPPEYVIVRKLEYYREGHSDKHIHDIRGMLEISGESIDHENLDNWIARLNLGDEWSEVRA